MSPGTALFAFSHMASRMVLWTPSQPMIMSPFSVVPSSRNTSTSSLLSTTSFTFFPKRILDLSGRLSYRTSRNALRSNSRTSYPWLCSLSTETFRLLTGRLQYGSLLKDEIKKFALHDCRPIRQPVEGVLHWNAGTLSGLQTPNLLQDPGPVGIDCDTCSIVWRGFVPPLQDYMLDVGLLKNMGRRQAGHSAADHDDSEPFLCPVIHYRAAFYKILVNWLKDGKMQGGNISLSARISLGME